MIEELEPDGLPPDGALGAAAIGLATEGAAIGAGEVLAALGAELGASKVGGWTEFGFRKAEICVGPAFREFPDPDFGGAHERLIAAESFARLGTARTV